MAPRNAVFLDRDGVINIDHGYVHCISQFEFVPGIFELTRFIVDDLGWPVIVATNQSGIGRGYFDEDAHFALTQWMCDRFRAQGATIAKVYHCPFHPEFGLGSYRVDHGWRKPKPGMFLQAARDFDLDLSGCVAIGDRITDTQAAAAAGIERRIMLDRNGTPAGLQAPPHRVVRNLEEALSVLRSEYPVAGRE
jgi:D-glycero-D-manno-heptose 1,7-bisphosphate phosphatase